MKQIWIYSLLLIIIFSCQSNEKAVGEEENVYPRKDWFSVSENDKWLDSLEN